MKKIISVLILSASLIGVSADAQKGGQHGMQMKQMLKDSLHLTDAQADSVVAIRAEFQKKIRSVMKDSTVAADKRKEEIQPLRKEMKTRLQAILTKEQMKKMQEMQQGMHGEGKMNNDN